MGDKAPTDNANSGNTQASVAERIRRRDRQTCQVCSYAPGGNTNIDMFVRQVGDDQSDPAAYETQCGSCADAPTDQLPPETVSVDIAGGPRRGGEYAAADVRNEDDPESKTIEDVVFHRDYHTCQECGFHPHNTDEDVSMEAIFIGSRGADQRDPSNYLTFCPHHAKMYHPANESEMPARYTPDELAEQYSGADLVIARDNQTCQMCGDPKEEALGELEAVFVGNDEDDSEHYVTLCLKCRNRHERDQEDADVPWHHKLEGQTRAAITMWIPLLGLIAGPVTFYEWVQANPPNLEAPVWYAIQFSTAALTMFLFTAGLVYFALIAGSWQEAHTGFFSQWRIIVGRRLYSLWLNRIKPRLPFQ